MQAAPHASNSFQEGEIHGTRMNLNTPFEMVLNFHASLTTLGRTTTSGRSGKMRPCVVMEVGEMGDPPTICLMATFGGDTVDNMPEVWRHFCVAVDPPIGHEGRRVGVSPTFPPQEGHSYIVALPIPSRRPLRYLFNAWTDNSGQKHPRHLNDLQQFAKTCEDILSAWQLLEENDPDFRERMLKDYQVSRAANERKKRSLNT